MMKHSKSEQMAHVDAVPVSGSPGSSGPGAVPETAAHGHRAWGPGTEADPPDDGASEPLPEQRRPLKGRGAVNSPSPRYHPQERVPVDDGWLSSHQSAEIDTDWEASADRIPTIVLPDHARTIITRNQSPDIPFDRSINAYRGCEHGCVYCFARPTHAYLDLSPGLDFESRLFYKPDAANLLRRELARRDYQPRPIAMGTNTDPYQPIERQYRVTRSILEVALETRHPVTITTKGALIERDLDLLTALAERNLVSVGVSVTTLSNELKRILEPRTASGARRLRTVSALRAADVPVSVLMAPVIPFVNDEEIESVVAAAVDAGALKVRCILLRLPLEVSVLFRAWLDEHYPLRAARVMAAVQATRGGQDYDSTWGRRFRGEGPVAEIIRTRFASAVKRLNGGQRLDGEEPIELNVADFRPPPDSRRTDPGQLSLL